MADYNIKAEITADISGFESGVKKAQKASKNLSSSISNVVKGFGKGGLSGAITSAGLALGAVGLAIGVVTKAAKAMAKTIGECTDAYKKQLNAERALDTAVKNSPILNGNASKNLKEFASQIQKTSNMGDEELLPMMTQLVATGRSEAEIMKIIQTATDMAATGTISFDTAVTQLNATLNGNVGRLGQQNAELKNLTKEELENGKAVDILAEKYKGMAANTIDTSKQLKNAIGDLKESFGAVFENAMAPMRKFFAEIIQGWADARKARDEYEKAEKAVASGTASSSQLVLYYEQQLKYIADEKKMYEGMYGADLEYAQSKLKNLELEEQKYKSLIATEKYRQTQADKAKLSEAEKQKLLEEEKAKEDEIVKLKEKYLQKIAEQEARWQNIEKVTGEVISNEEKVKFYEDSLVDIMTEAGGQITENNQYYKDQIAIIERLYKGIQKNEDVKTSDTWAGKIREQAIQRLEAEKEATLKSEQYEKASAEEKIKIANYYNDKLRELNRQRIEEERQKALESVKDYENAQEERIRINQYYDNQILDNNLSFINQVEAQGEEAGIAFGEEFAIAVSIVKQTAKKIVEVTKKIVSGIKSVVKGAINIFQNMFKFDPDKALDNLLAFEDSVLTFFVETLPQLPQFFASAIQSIEVLLSNLGNAINSGEIGNIIAKLIESITGSLPNILDSLVNLISKIIDGIVEGLVKNKDKILNSIRNLLKGVLRLIKEVIPELLKFIVEFLPELLKLIVEFVPQILSALKDVIIAIAKALPDLIPAILEALPEIIASVVEFIIGDLPNIIYQIIKGLVLGFAEVNWGKVVKDCFMGFINGFKKLFGIHSPSTVFEGFGKNIVQGLLNGLKGIGDALLGVFQTAFSGIQKFFGNITNWFANAFSDLKDFVKSGWDNLVDGTKNLGEKLGDGLTTAWDKVKTGVTTAVEKTKEVATTVGTAIKEGASNAWEKTKEVATTVATAVAETAKKAGSAIASGFKKVKGWLGFANGTNNAPKGLAMVGEAGPELVRFRGGEQVLNNRNTQKALANMGKGSSIFNVTFNNTQDTTAFAMMNQLKQYQRNLAFNGVL